MDQHEALKLRMKNKILLVVFGMLVGVLTLGYIVELLKGGKGPVYIFTFLGVLYTGFVLSIILFNKFKQLNS